MTGSGADTARFGALADDTRRAILALLSERGEASVSEITARLDHVGRTAISTHLRVLREAGLVHERKQGKYRHYSVRPEPVAEVVNFLSTLYKRALPWDAANRQSTMERN